jgi:hypothetical protein
MRSFSTMRTSPVVVSRVRTTSVPAVRKQTLSAVNQPRLKNYQSGHKLKNRQVVDKLKNKQAEDKLKNANLSARALPCIGAAGRCRGPGGGESGGGGKGTNPGGTNPGGTNPVSNPPPAVVAPPNIVNPPPGNPPPVTINPPGTFHPPVPPVVVIPPPIKPPPIIPPPINPPPVVVVPPHPPASVSVGIGAVAPVVEADPPGCTYERSVRTLPGGGLQRVIIKVCPDA